jgi:hypothetical protein
MRTWIHSFNRKRSAHRPNRLASKIVSHRRRGVFESLEPRLALAVDLGFALAFESLAGMSESIRSGWATGMVTDASGNSYVTINGGVDHTIDLDPGPALAAATLDAGLAKLDPSGALVWAAAFNATGGASPYVRIVHAVDADQNVYLVGNFRGTVDFDPGPGAMNVTSSQAGAETSVYLSKLNSAGELEWVHTLDSRGLSPSQLVLDGNGNLVIVASFSQGSNFSPIDVDPGTGVFLAQQIGSVDQLLLKYDSQGDFIWARQLGGVGASAIGPASVAVDGQGDVFVAGSYSGTVDLDPGAGVHFVTNNDTAADGYVVRLNPAGDFVWAYVTEGNGSASFKDIDIASDGSVVVGAHFKGAVDFQPGSGSYLLTTIGTYEKGLVLKLAGDSSLLWARQYGIVVAGQVYGRAVDVDQEGNIYLTGNFGADDPVDFDPGPGVYELFTPGSHNTGYVLSLTEDSDFRWAVPFGGNARWTYGESVSVTPGGDVHVSGTFRDQNDFDPHPVEEFWLNSGAVSNVFAATLDQANFNPGMPAVDAGASQNILVTDSAALDGTVTDDGLPSPVTTTWSVYSGPGSVTFADASAIDTTATFSASGEYWLQLEATDTQFTATDYVRIVVDPVSVALTATADTYLSGDKKTVNSNFGAASSLIADGNPDFGALLRWDLSSIPGGSTLESATLSLNITGTSPDTYEIYELRRSWTESQATWNKAASGANWQSAGAKGSSDRGSTVLGTVTATATGIHNVVLNAAGLAVVQGWVNNPSTNFGFVIQDYANTTRDDLVFSSKEATVAASRPQLKVLYNPPSSAPLALGALEGPASVSGATDDAFAAQPVTISTGGHDTAVAKLAQPFALGVTTPHPSNLFLAAAPARRIPSKAADAAMSDLGHSRAAGYDGLLDDGLLWELVSGQSLSMAVY